MGGLLPGANKELSGNGEKGILLAAMGLCQKGIAAGALSAGLTTVAALGQFLNVGGDTGGGVAPSIAASSSSSGGTPLASTVKYTANFRKFYIEFIHSQVFMT